MAEIPVGHKTCSQCKATKLKTEFYKRSGKDDRNRLAGQCKECTKSNVHAYQIANAERRSIQQKEYREKNRDAVLQRLHRYYSANKPKFETARKNWRETNKYRYWFHASKLTKIKSGKQFELDWPEIKSIFEVQGYCCALTGIPFYSSKVTEKGVFSWSSPSLDRIDYKKGYVLDNVRIVLFCINSFRGRMTDDEMYTVAEALLANRSSGDQP